MRGRGHQHLVEGAAIDRRFMAKADQRFLVVRALMAASTTGRVNAATKICIVLKPERQAADLLPLAQHLLDPGPLDDLLAALVRS